MNEELVEALESFTSSGERETYALQSNEAILELWQARQAILTEMSMAIRDAVNEVKARYQSQLDEANSEYAFYLKMSTPPRDHNS